MIASILYKFYYSCYFYDNCPLIFFVSPISSKCNTTHFQTKEITFFYFIVVFKEIEFKSQGKNSLIEIKGNTFSLYTFA